MLYAMFKGMPSKLCEEEAQVMSVKHRKMEVEEHRFIWTMSVKFGFGEDSIGLGNHHNNNEKKYYYFIIELNLLLHVNNYTIIRLGKSCVPLGNY